MTQLIAWLSTKSIHWERNNTKWQGEYGKLFWTSKNILPEQMLWSEEYYLLVHTGANKNRNKISIFSWSSPETLQSSNNSGWKGSLDVHSPTLGQLWGQTCFSMALSSPVFKTSMAEDSTTSVGTLGPTAQLSTWRRSFFLIQISRYTQSNRNILKMSLFL